MAQLDAEQRAQFNSYMEAVSSCADDLAFLLDNYGESIELDYSGDSLAALETFFNQFRTGLADADEPFDDGTFLQVAAMYLGECIRKHAGGAWKQQHRKVAQYAQPMVAGFSDKPAHEFYPLNAQELPEWYENKAQFSWVREQRVWGHLFHQAVAVSRRKNA